MLSSWTFSLLKLTEVMSYRESVKRFSYNIEIPAMISLLSTLTAKKSMKMTFSWYNINVYYNFSQENPTITNI